MISDEVKYYTNLFLNTPKENSIKSDYGKLFIIAGSKNYPFAGLISEQAAYIASPGYISFLTNDFNKSVYYNRCQLTTTFINCEYTNDSYNIEQSLDSILKYDSILFGNGLNDDEANLNTLDKLITCYKGNLIIDATGIYLLKKVSKEILKNHACHIILTPHLKECDDFLNTNIKNQRDAFLYLKEAMLFSKQYNIDLLIKGSSSLIVTPDEYIFNKHSNTSLSKAGTGDFLAGLLAGFLSYSDKMNVGKIKVIDYVDTLLHDTATILEKKKLIRSINVFDIKDYIETLKE